MLNLKELTAEEITTTARKIADKINIQQRVNQETSKLFGDKPVDPLSELKIFRATMLLIRDSIDNIETLRDKKYFSATFKLISIGPEGDENLKVFTDAGAEQESICFAMEDKPEVKEVIKEIEENLNLKRYSLSASIEGIKEITLKEFSEFAKR